MMSEPGTRLEQAEARLNKAEAALAAVGRALEAAEKAQSVAERPGMVPSLASVAVVGGAVIVAIVFVLSRRQG